MTRAATAGRSCPTCRSRPVGWARRSSLGGWWPWGARAPRASSTPSSPSTSRRASGRSCLRMRTPRHGTAVAAVGDSLYAIDGAAATGHVHSTRTVEALDFGSAPSGAPTVSGLKWRSGRDAPSARQFAASTVDDHAIWLFGGLAATTSTKKVEAYDPAIDTWKIGPDLPLPAAPRDGRDVQRGSGGDRRLGAGGANLTAQTSNRVFALRNGAWVELPKLKHARAAAAAAVVGDKIVVVGGRPTGSSSGPVRCSTARAGRTPPTFPRRVTTWRRPRTASTCTRSVGGSCRRTRTSVRWSAMTRPATVGRTCRTCRLRPVGWARRSSRGNWWPAEARAPRASSTPFSPSTCRTNKWSKLTRSRRRHGTTVDAIGDSLYVIAGAAAHRPRAAPPRRVEALDFK